MSISVSVKDSGSIDAVVPPSEVSVTSSNKRKTTNDISTVTTPSSSLKHIISGTELKPLYQLLQHVLSDDFNRRNGLKNGITSFATADVIKE